MGEVMSRVAKVNHTRVNYFKHASMNILITRRFSLLALYLFLLPVAMGKPSDVLFTGKKSSFRGFDRFEVVTDKGSISVICPKNPKANKPWMWRSIFWGKESRAVKRCTDADAKLLEMGYYVVVAPGDVSGHPRGNVAIDAAYKLLTEKYGFAKKLSMASMSRETLALFRWASANPEKVSSIYVDNGVCNVRSWPAGKLVEGSNSEGKGNKRSWNLLKQSYDFQSDQEALAVKASPIDWLEPIAKAKIPILLVCGTEDKTVPYSENGEILKKRYQALGGDIQVILEKKDHHPHGLNDPQQILDFITKY